MPLISKQNVIVPPNLWSYRVGNILSYQLVYSRQDLHVNTPKFAVSVGLRGKIAFKGRISLLTSYKPTYRDYAEKL